MVFISSYNSLIHNPFIKLWTEVRLLGATPNVFIMLGLAHTQRIHNINVLLRPINSNAKPCWIELNWMFIRISIMYNIHNLTSKNSFLWLGWVLIFLNNFYWMTRCSLNSFTSVSLLFITGALWSVFHTKWISVFITGALWSVFHTKDIRNPITWIC